MPSPTEITASSIEQEDLSAYINEYAHDDAGNFITDTIRGGLQMTARGAKAREQAYLQDIEQWPPMEQLPAEYDAEHTNTSALLAFGFGVTYDQLLHHVHKNNIRAPWNPDHPITEPIDAFSVIHARLGTAIPGLQLFYRRPSSLEYDRVLALYSNQSMGRLQYVDADEQRVIEYIKKELEINYTPMWYWDMDEEATF